MCIVEKCGIVLSYKKLRNSDGWVGLMKHIHTYIPEQALVMFWKKKLKIIFSTQSFEDRWSDLMCLLLAV